jgi:hypothetical protein
MHRLRPKWTRNVQVFRTYNASVTLDRLLWSNEDGTPGDGIAADGTIAAKKASYDRANTEARHEPAAHCLGCWHNERLLSAQVHPDCSLPSQSDGMKPSSY